MITNLEPIPYNPPDVLDDDAHPVSQNWTNIKKKAYATRVTKLQ